MHHVQQKILIKLTSESPLKFSQLQPSNVPNNTFAYHLKKLVDTGYLIHAPNGYIPTKKALKIYHFENKSIYTSTPNPRLITIIYITNPKGNVKDISEWDTAEARLDRSCIYPVLR